jgi:hypothetical protein
MMCGECHQMLDMFWPSSRGGLLQGSLAHQKHPPRRTLQQPYA